MEFRGKNPEKQLQKYVEKYLNEFFNAYYLRSEYQIPSARIDTLAITSDGNPMIIEYKHKNDKSILNQTVYYYDWLQKKSTKYEFETLVKKNEKTKELVVDWNKIKLVCIAKDYSKWEISLINHLDTRIECYIYTYHKNELDIHLDPIIYRATEIKPSPSKSGTEEPTLETHMNKGNERTKKLLQHLREKIFKLGDDIQEGYTPGYIKYFVDVKFMELHVRKKRLLLLLRVNEKHFKDPKNMTKDISHRGWPYKREVYYEKEEDLKDILALIKQAYEYR